MRRLPASPLALSGLALLAGLNGWFLLVLSGSLSSDDSSTSEDAVWSPKLPSLTLETEPEAAATGRSEILLHPVFFKSRAPYVPPSPAPPKIVALPAPPFVDPGFVLGGVMINGPNRKAYLLQRAERSGTWVREGDDFVGWKVETISKGGAKLQKESHAIEVQLYPDH